MVIQTIARGNVASGKIVQMILHAEHQRRHRCKEETFGHSWGRGGWDDLRE